MISQFYAAFGRCDGEAMCACYADDVRFSDPAFPGLEGNRAKSMWRMLTKTARDLRVEASNIVADETSGSAHWEAWYTFSRSGRKVHNIIEARFKFRDGKIIEHTDAFNFWRWSRQALGISGLLLGWTPMLQKTVQRNAAKGLDAFIAK